MSQVKFISDLHIGHKRILEFAGHYRSGSTVEEHDELLIWKIASNMTKRDRLYILGDVILGANIPLSVLDRIPGDKILVRGNHDERFTAREFLEVFKDVLGVSKYKGYWLTHVPMHPDELRGKKNIHGHTHQNSIRDALGNIDHRYINVCVESLGGFPITFQEINDGTYDRTRHC